MGDAFWDRPSLKAAFTHRQFGLVIRAYRQARGAEVTQAHVAGWLGISQGQLSRLERGKSLANDLDKLNRWTQALRIPARCLWFSALPHSPSAYLDPQVADNLPPLSGSEGEHVQRRQFLKATGVGMSLFKGGVAANTVPRSVGDPDVETVREMTNTFRRLDNKFGGGHSRSAATKFLASTVEPMINHGRYRSAVGSELFSVAAELHQLIGWMTYDVGQAGLGRKHLRFALRLCQEVGNDALAAEMLAGMSHQTAFLGAGEDATDLALAARQTAKRTGLATLRAEAAVMEAHGLAIQRDKTGCMAALREAEHAFGSRNDQELPAWLSYLDEAYLAAKFGHVFRDLGQPREAERFARRALEMSEGYERGRLFNTALLASTLADQGKIDEACTTAASAVQMTDTVRSVRTVSYLVDIGQRLWPYRENADVRGLYQNLTDAGVLLPGQDNSAPVKGQHMQQPYL